MKSNFKETGGERDDDLLGRKMHGNKGKPWHMTYATVVVLCQGSSKKNSIKLRETKSMDRCMESISNCLRS